MDLNEFKTQITKQGLAKNNRWILRIYPPRMLTSTNRALSDILNKNGSNLNVNIPGLDLLDTFVDSVNDIGLNIGNTRLTGNLNVPTLGYVLSNMGSRVNAINLFCHQVNMPEINTQNFNWSEYGEERKLGYTHTYSDMVASYYCSEDLRERKFFEDWLSLVYNSKNKQYGYYNDYISTIEMVQYDSGFKNQMAIYKFNEAYCSQIGASEHTYESGTYMKLDVSFKYRSYERIK